MDMLRSPPNVLEKASTSYNQHMQLHNSQVPTLYSILYLFCFLFISFVVLLFCWTFGDQARREFSSVKPELSGHFT